METEHGLPNQEDLSDGDFVKLYPENGFGWQTFTDKDTGIFERHAQLRQTKPELYNEGVSSGINITNNSNEELPEKRTQLKNLDGQIVDPKTNEPVQPGSAEWQKLATKNELPLNQTEKKHG